MIMEKPASAKKGHPWRWMILLSRFGYAFIFMGCFKAQGVFIPHFVEDLSADTAAAGFATSAIVAVGGISASPFVGALVKKCAPRKLTMAGGVVAASGILAASFTSSMTPLTVCYALSSVGMAFVAVSSVKPHMEYFPEDFATTNGLALAGGTIGMMVLPPIMEWLVSLYGWRNALGLLGAISYNYVLCGALLRPQTVDAPYHQIQSQNDEDSSFLTIKQHLDGESSNEETTVCGKILAVLGERFDSEVLTEPLFVLYQFVFVLYGMVFAIWHLFLIPHCMALGYGSAPSAFLATFAGIGSLVGRLGNGYPVDRNLLRASTLFAAACLVFAASSLLDPLAVSSYAALAFLAMVSGFANGLMLPLMFILMREVCADEHTSAFSWLFVSFGVGELLGGVVGGWIRDAAGEYKSVFISIGGVSIFMVALVALTRCLGCYCKTRD